VPEKSTRLDACGELPDPLFGLEKKPTFEPNLTNAEAYCRVLWVFILCMQAVFTTEEFALVGQFVRTNKGSLAFQTLYGSAWETSR